MDRKQPQYTVRVFEKDGSQGTHEFDSRIERAQWLILNGYKPDHVLGFTDPASDHRPGQDVFDV